ERGVLLVPFTRVHPPGPGAGTGAAGGGGRAREGGTARRVGSATMSSATPSDVLGVTFAGFTPLGPRRATEVAVRAEQLGYRSYWTAEASGPESFAVLGAVGAVAPGLDLGTGIIPIQVRSPLLAAMGAATLQALHPER